MREQAEISGTVVKVIADNGTPVAPGMVSQLMVFLCGKRLAPSLDTALCRCLLLHISKGK